MPASWLGSEAVQAAPRPLARRRHLFRAHRNELLRHDAPFSGGGFSVLLASFDAADFARLLDAVMTLYLREIVAAAADAILASRRQ